MTDSAYTRSAFEALLEARALLEQGRPADAAKGFEYVVRSGRPSYYIQAGFAYAKARDADNAERCYIAAVKAGVHSAPLEYGSFLFQQHRPADAARVFDTAARAGRPAFFIRAGFAWANAGHTGHDGSAEQSFKAALDENVPLAPLAYGRFLFEQGRFIDAAEVLDAAALAGQTECYFPAGHAYANAGKRKDARRCFEVAVTVTARARWAVTALGLLESNSESPAPVTVAESTPLTL